MQNRSVSKHLIYYHEYCPPCHLKPRISQINTNARKTYIMVKGPSGVHAIQSVIMQVIKKIR